MWLAGSIFCYGNTWLINMFNPLHVGTSNDNIHVVIFSHKLSVANSTEIYNFD